MSGADRLFRRQPPPHADISHRQNLRALLCQIQLVDTSSSTPDMGPNPSFFIRLGGV